MRKITIYNSFLMLIAVAIFILLLNGLFWIELSILRYWTFENIKADINLFSAISMMATCIILPIYIAGKVASGFINVFFESSKKNTNRSKNDN